MRYGVWRRAIHSGCGCGQLRDWIRHCRCRRSPFRDRFRCGSAIRRPWISLAQRPDRMTTNPLPTLAAPSESPRMLQRARTLWPLTLFVLTLLFLAVDRWRYLTHFGFVYTEADQATLWVQADDIAHGI